MKTPGHARWTGSRRPGAAPKLALALAGAVASVVIGVAIASAPARSHRLDALRPAASHPAAPALDGALALRVYDEVDRRARTLPPDERASVARTILEEAPRAGLAPELVLAVIHVESSFRHRAASRAGALGLMQLRPRTMHAELARARLRSADPLDPAANVRAGVRYLGRLVRAFDDLELALVAYNAGPARLRRHLAAGQVPERLLRYARVVRRVAAEGARGSRVAAASARTSGGAAESATPPRVAAARIPGDAVAKAAGVAAAKTTGRAVAKVSGVAAAMTPRGAAPPAARLALASAHAGSWSSWSSRASAPDRTGALARTAARLPRPVRSRPLDGGRPLDAALAGDPFRPRTLARRWPERRTPAAIGHGC